MVVLEEHCNKRLRATTLGCCQLWVDRLMIEMAVLLLGGLVQIPLRTTKARLQEKGTTLDYISDVSYRPKAILRDATLSTQILIETVGNEK